MRAFNIDIKSFEDNSCNAGSKAHADVNSILEQEGYRTLFVFLHKSPLAKLMLNVVVTIKYFCIIPRQSKVLIQYPSSKYIIALVLLLKLKKCQLTVLIHDLDSCRYDPGMKSYEVRLFNLMNKVIVHSTSMQEKLTEYGVTSTMVCLGLFDYLLEKPYTGKRINSGNVIFAGNLSKSGFVNQLSALPLSYSSIHLYGLPECKDSNNNVVYKGVFKSDDLSKIDGSWGLVWDGDSLNDLIGLTGNYQTINSPHKASLYIAAGLPLIVSKRAALAEYVQKHKIGIVINSLFDIEEKLKDCTDDKYNDLLYYVERERAKLLSGQHLKSII